MASKYRILFAIFFCTSCLSENKRTNEIVQHLYSQEDSSFYFSDCKIPNRSDSFELVRIGNFMKFFNVPNLCKTSINEVRLIYGRAFREPYLISLRSDGDMTISTVDTVSYLNGTQYELKEDTLHFSGLEKKILHYTRMYRRYQWNKMPDSAAMLKKNYPEFIDSIYDLHLRLTNRIPVNDTIIIIRTILDNQVEMFNKVVEKLESIDFWNMPIYEISEANDGSSWTLEAKINGRHHVSCKVNWENKDFEKVCKILLKFTPISSGDIY